MPDAGPIDGSSAHQLSPLGLPVGIEACLFDLDGVLTRTADVHAAAWKEMFDAYLAERAQRDGSTPTPFVFPSDYTLHVDGKLRQDGVRDFLSSRGIELPEGMPDDPPEAETVNGLGNRKNVLVLEIIHTKGVATYERSVDYVRAVAAAGLRRAVVSASRNCREVLRAAGIEDLFEVRIDGTVAAERGLPGKPAPDMFVAAAAALGVDRTASVVFEDAVSGVAAGRAGGFGFVVGVDRVGHADALRANGADTVVDDLGDLLEDP